MELALVDQMKWAFGAEAKTALDAAPNFAISPMR